MKKRFIYLMSSAAVALGLIILGVMAAPPTAAEEIVCFGTAGDGIAWTLSADKTLTITGEGVYDENNVRIDPSCEYVSRKAATKVIVGEGITALADKAFYNYAALTELKLPESLKSIGKEAFKGTEKLLELRIPDGLEYIAPTAVKARQNVFVPDTGVGVYYEVKYASVGSSAAKAMGRSGILFRPPDTLYNLLYEYKDGVETSLQLVSVDKSAVEITVPGYVDIIAMGAFEKCQENLKRVFVEEGVKIVRSHAFGSCKNLVRVTLPSTITRIEDFAFCWCSSLKGLYLPDNITFIGETCFQTSPTKLYATRGTKTARAVSRAGYSFRESDWEFDLKYEFDGTSVSGLCLTGVDGHVESLVIPDYVTAVGSKACYEHKNLKDITFSKNLRRIDRQAFFRCNGLVSVVLPDGLTTIGQSAFGECALLQSVLLPDSVTTIEANGFYRCPALKDIALPPRLTTLGAAAFDACTSLKSVTIPDSLTVLSASVFSGCRALTAIEIPAGVTEIGNSAFSYCNALARVTFAPGSADLTIGDSAFFNCRKLTQITIPARVSRLGRSAFSFESNDDTPRKIAFLGRAVTIGGQSSESYIISGKPEVYCFEGSDAAAWALEKGYTIHYLDGAGFAEICQISSDAAMTLSCGEARTAPVRVFPDDMSRLAWTSDSPAVAVADGGVVTGVSAGTARITASAGQQAATFTVTVRSVLTLPAGLKVIGPEALSGLDGVDVIVMPDGVTEIADDALAGFRGTIRAAGGSYAAAWGASHGFNVVTK